MSKNEEGAKGSGKFNSRTGEVIGLSMKISLALSQNDNVSALIIFTANMQRLFSTAVLILQILYRRCLVESLVSAQAYLLPPPKKLNTLSPKKWQSIFPRNFYRTFTDKS